MSKIDPAIDVAKAAWGFGSKILGNDAVQATAKGTAKAGGHVAKNAGKVAASPTGMKLGLGGAVLYKANDMLGDVASGAANALGIEGIDSPLGKAVIGVGALGAGKIAWDKMTGPDKPDISAMQLPMMQPGMAMPMPMMQPMQAGMPMPMEMPMEMPGNQPSVER